MKVREVMSTPAMVIDPNKTIRDAAKQMRSENVGALPVGENMSGHVYYCFEDLKYPGRSTE